VRLKLLLGALLLAASVKLWRKDAGKVAAARAAG